MLSVQDQKALTNLRRLFQDWSQQLEHAVSGQDRVAIEQGIERLTTVEHYIDSRLNSMVRANQSVSQDDGVQKTRDLLSQHHSRLAELRDAHTKPATEPNAPKPAEPQVDDEPTAKPSSGGR